MIIYPAIDLISGKAVRLMQGDYAKKTEYSDNPVEVAKEFEVDGAEYIHIVDLDGAKAKQPVNIPSIKAISEAVDAQIQVGGGVRTVESAEQLLQYANRVIIGTVAITEPKVLEKLINKFGPGKIIVSVDYKNGTLAINGWLETSSVDTQDLKERLIRQGIKTVIVTDVSKDGLLDGPNIELMRLWKQAGLEVICAGGVTTADNIVELSSASVDGVIIGKALYEKKISLKEALNAS